MDKKPKSILYYRLAAAAFRCLPRYLKQPQHGGHMRQVGAGLRDLGFVHSYRGADFVFLFGQRS